MDADTKRKTSIIQEEKRRMFNDMTQLNNDIDVLGKEMSTIETACYRGKKDVCLATIDNYLVSLIDLDRRYHKTIINDLEECFKSIPRAYVPEDFEEWPVRSKEEYNALSQFMQCSRPIFDTQTVLLREKIDLLNEANTKLRGFLT